MTRGHGKNNWFPNQRRLKVCKGSKVLSLTARKLSSLKVRFCLAPVRLRKGKIQVLVPTATYGPRRPGAARRSTERGAPWCSAKADSCKFTGFESRALIGRVWFTPFLRPIRHGLMSGRGQIISQTCPVMMRWRLIPCRKLAPSFGDCLVRRHKRASWPQAFRRQSLGFRQSPRGARPSFDAGALSRMLPVWSL